MGESTYDKLDALIVTAIEKRRSALYDSDCQVEADRIAKLTGRESFRVIDGRLQRLRKRGVLTWAPKPYGWRVARRAEQTKDTQ